MAKLPAPVRASEVESSMPPMAEGFTLRSEVDEMSERLMETDMIPFDVAQKVSEVSTSTTDMEGMLNLVLEKLDSSFFLAKQIVYEKGECGFELFILTRGAVDMMDGKVSGK